MLIRFLTFRAKPDKFEDLRKFFSTEIFAGLQQTEGCLFASLVESTTDPNEFSSLTLWDSTDHIRAYEEGDRAAAWVKAIEPLLAESDEWRVQLADDMTLEYKPVVERPQPHAYTLCAVMDEEAVRQSRVANMHLRLLRLQVKDDGFESFKDAYVNTIIPALREVKGCRNAFLLENVEAQNQLISVTVWDSREDAEAYDRGPVFRSLLANTRELFSAHVWQTTLKSDVADKVYINDDVKVQSYSVVTGRNFPAHRA